MIWDSKIKDFGSQAWPCGGLLAQPWIFVFINIYIYIYLYVCYYICTYIMRTLYIDLFYLVVYIRVRGWGPARR